MMRPRLSLLAVVAVFCLFSAAAHGFSLIKTGDDFVPLRWLNIDLPVTYRINGANTDMTSQQAIDTINVAFATWEAVGSSSAASTYLGTTTAGGFANNGQTTISFDDPDNDLGSGTLGLTFVWFFGGGDGNFTVTGGREFDQITDADIVFNDDDFAFVPGTQMPSGSQYDLQSVAAHEIGHLFALDHPPITAATMYRFISAGSASPRTLHPDDEDGISYVYTAAPVVGGVSPTTIDSNTATPLAITGTGFVRASANPDGSFGFATDASVTIGGQSATGVVIVSPTEITCVTPALGFGEHDVTVTNPDTTSDTLSGGLQVGGGSGDSDGDGLPDNTETNTGIFVDETDTGTDPEDPDTDNDGLNDGEEINTYGTDPNDDDSDNDGLPDGWEVDNGLDPTDDTGENGSTGDPDGDGLNNLEEYERSYDPQSPAPAAGFRASPTSGSRPLAVNFADESTGAITTWSWTFGDGSTGTARNASHTYYFMGAFTVSLTVSGPGGSDTETRTAFIHVDQALPAEGRSFKAIIDDIKVTYTKPTCFAGRRGPDGQLVIGVWGDDPGVLNVIAREDAFTFWGARSDVFIDGPEASITKIRLLGRPETELFVSGQVGYAKKFVLKHGFVGDTLDYGEEFGLGSASEELPKNILIKSGAATAPLFGVSYPSAPFDLTPVAKHDPFVKSELSDYGEDYVDVDEDEDVEERAMADESAAGTKAAYRFELGDIVVRYSKPGGAVAFHNPADNTLTIEIFEDDGDLKVICAPVPDLGWEDHCDIYIDAPTNSVNVMNLQGTPETQLRVAGEIGYVKNFKLKYGIVGNTEHHGPDVGLSIGSLALPNKIKMKWGWTTAPVLGVFH